MHQIHIRPGLRPIYARWDWEPGELVTLLFSWDLGPPAKARRGGRTNVCPGRHAATDPRAAPPLS